MAAKKKTAAKATARIVRRTAPKQKPSFLRKLATKGAARGAGASTSLAVGALEAVSPKGALLTSVVLILGGSVVEALAPEGVAADVAGNIATSNLGGLAKDFGKSSTTKLLEANRAKIEERARELAREEFHGLAPEMDMDDAQEVAQVELDQAPPSKPPRRRKGG